MNCDVVQRHLLGCESPDRPSAAATAHLAGCAVCREWLQRLLQVERAVPELPVPSADAARTACLHRILTLEGPRTNDKGHKTRDVRRPSIARILGSWILDQYSSPRRRVAAGLVVGVAAALLLFLTGLLLWHSDRPPEIADSSAKQAPDAIGAAVVRAGFHGAEGKKGTERVKAMAEIADQLYLRCRDAIRADNNDDPIAMAQLYGKVVDEGVVKTAEGLSLEERRDILGPIADNLKNAESEWGRLTQQNGLAPGVKVALEKAALAAHTGNAQLTKLCAA